jgi:hypothetical protein
MGSSPSKTSNLDPTLISGSFPVVIKGCENVSTDLFACLEKKGKRTGNDDSASVPNNPNSDPSKRLVGTVEECANLIKKYNDCYETKIGNRANEKFRKVQERVPEEYRYQGKQ